MSNSNNICGDGALPSSPNDVKLLFKKFKEEVDKLLSNTENLVLEQNGKIGEVYQYLKNNLSDSVRCLLDDMEASGELDEIIEECLLNASKNEKVARHKVDNLIVNIHHILTYNTEFHDEPSQYNIQQGGCFIPKNNSYIIAKINKSENEALLQEYSWDGENLLREKVLKLYHANWISYDATMDELYISPMFNNKDFSSIAEVIILDYETLEIKRTVSLQSKLESLGYKDAMISSCNYDYITNKVSVGVYDISDGYKKRLFKWCPCSNALEEIHLENFINELEQEGCQGFLTHNDVAYLLVNKVIYSYDMLTGKPIKAYNVPYKDGLGIILGEPEQISVMNPDDVESDFLFVLSNTGGKSWYKYSFACRTNIYHGLVQKVREINAPTTNRLYVDYNASSLIQDGTAEKPYKTLELALMINDHSDSVINIHIPNKCDKLGNLYFDLYNNRPIWILGYGSTANIIKTGKNDITLIDILQNLTNNKANEEYNYKIETSKVNIITNYNGVLATDDICCLYSELNLVSSANAKVKQVKESKISILNTVGVKVKYDHNNINNCMGLNIKGMHDVVTNADYNNLDFKNMDDSNAVFHFMNLSSTYGLLDVNFQTNWLKYNPQFTTTKGSKTCTYTFRKTAEGKLHVDCVDSSGATANETLTMEILK